MSTNPSINSTPGFVKVVAHGEWGEKWIGIKRTNLDRVQADVEEWLTVIEPCYTDIRIGKVEFVPESAHQVVAILYAHQCDAYSLLVDDLPYASVTVNGTDRYVDASVMRDWETEDDENVIQAIPAATLKGWLKIYHSDN